LDKKTPLNIALVGNPNTGKTTLFNALTGLRQRIGNYPGITVSMHTGTVFLGKEAAYITDLPGTYSLAASSPDEKIVHDYINGNVKNAARPDVLVCVLDATNLAKSLFLVSQLAEHQIPMVIALSFWDSAVRQKTRFELKLLETRLNVPIVPVNVRKNQGITKLKEAILSESNSLLGPTRILWKAEVRAIFESLQKDLASEGVTLSDAEVQRVIFDTTLPTIQGLQLPRSELKPKIDEARAKFRRIGLHPHAAEAVLHHEHISAILQGIVIKDTAPRTNRGESIDRLLTHRFWGLIVFLLSMYVVFQSVYSWSAPFMDLIDMGKEWAQGHVGGWLVGYPDLQSLVVDGAIEGVGAFVIFLPQILILFFFISLLEETGYMARAAFLMDKIFSWTGLNGKSFVPLLSSFACAVPGVLATRTIEDRKARITTILIAPLMSCSARLPVYVLVIGALVEPRYGSFVAGLTLFGIHFLGIIVALPTAFLLNVFQKRTPSRPFIIEFPEYQIPKFRDMFWRMWSEGKEFIIRAGTIIFAMTILIWAALYYPRPDNLEAEVREATLAAYEADPASFANDGELDNLIEKRIDAAYINQSYLSRFGKSVQPVFDWAGFDWRISVGILASFPAREVIVSTMGVILSLGGEVDEESPSLKKAIQNTTWQDGPRTGQPLFTVPVAFAIMVFFALCQQCGSTLAVIKSETNWGWAAFSFCYMTTLAWIGAILTYQGLSLVM
jgi:ferrous iron transport protein B